jgi:3-deoxy-manno-octulosonate cytidylyltransferase (CMP-KDO synthetase)
MSTRHTAIVIPARLASTRLPAKPLRLLNGRPMIAHVVERALEAAAGEVIVATDDARIIEACAAASGAVRVAMTSPDLPSGSDRVQAALAALDPGQRFTRVVNLQGDIPAISPDAIRGVAALLHSGGESFDIATLGAWTESAAELADPAVVKMAAEPLAALPGAVRALWFSRATLPHGARRAIHHVGIYAYRRSALERFVRLPPAVVEQAERLEQLRALAAGMRMVAGIIPETPIGVDTESHIPAAEAQLARLLARRHR